MSDRRYTSVENDFFRGIANLDSENMKDIRTNIGKFKFNDYIQQSVFIKLILTDKKTSIDLAIKHIKRLEKHLLEYRKVLDG